MSDGSDTTRCRQCGNEYKSIGGHWSLNPNCTHPEPSDRQRDILEALLMVAGNITEHEDSARNAFFQMASVNKPFLEWVDDELGVFTTGVREIRDSGEMRDNMAKFRDVAPESLDEESFNTEYALNSRHFPFLSIYAQNWYTEDGERRVPKTVDASPLKLRILYSLVGQLRHNDTRHIIEIPFYSADIDDDVLRRFFDGFGTTHTNRNETHVVQIANCRRFFEHIGGPLPGFEDKWLDPDEIDEPDTECPACYGRYENLSAHFTMSSVCSGPDITDHQHELLSGLLLSGAYLRESESDDAAQLQLASTETAYLEWVADELGWLANPIREDVSESEAREQFENWTNRDDLSDYNINASYLLTTRMHAGIAEQYRGWFEDPAAQLAQFEPTPLRCKLVFARRGSARQRSNGTTRIHIHHGHIPLKHRELAEFFYEFTPQHGGDNTITLTDAARFLAYIGDPIPGCEGRWNGDVYQNTRPAPESPD